MREEQDRTIDLIGALMTAAVRTYTALVAEQGYRDRLDQRGLSPLLSADRMARFAQDARRESAELADLLDHVIDAQQKEAPPMTRPSDDDVTAYIRLGVISALVDSARATLNAAYKHLSEQPALDMSTADPALERPVLLGARIITTAASLYESIAAYRIAKTIDTLYLHGHTAETTTPPDLVNRLRDFARDSLDRVYLQLPAPYPATGNLYRYLADVSMTAGQIKFLRVVIDRLGHRVTDGDRENWRALHPEPTPEEGPAPGPTVH